MTFSRGCLLAIVVTSVGLGLIMRQLRPWLVGSSCLAAVALLAAWPWLSAKIMDRATDVDNMTLRFKLWETAGAIFGEHPLLGAGFGNFPYYQMEAIRKYGIGPFYEFGQDSIDKIGVAENTYLQLAAETGVVGLISFAALLLVYFAIVIRVARTAPSPLTRDLAFCLGAGGLAYLINGLTITAYTHYVITVLLFGAFFGFGLVLARSIGSESDQGICS